MFSKQQVCRRTTTQSCNDFLVVVPEYQTHRSCAMRGWLRRPLIAWPLAARTRTFACAWPKKVDVRTSQRFFSFIAFILSRFPSVLLMKRSAANCSRYNLLGRDVGDK